MIPSSNEANPMNVCALLALGISLMPPAASAASSPSTSIDCKLAKTAVERTICADPELATLDAALAAAYGDALTRVRSERALAAALTCERSEFLASRESVLRSPDASLSRYMRSWRQWLEAIGGPSTSLQGVWINGSGSMVIRPRAAEGYTVVAKGDDPIRGSYTCEFIGIGRLRGDRIEVVWDTSEDEEDGAEGWTLDIRRQGSLLELQQRRNGSEAPTAPFCGNRGSLEGTYLPARVLPQPARAWHSAEDEGWRAPSR